MFPVGILFSVDRPVLTGVSARQRAVAGSEEFEGSQLGAVQTQLTVRFQAQHLVIEQFASASGVFRIAPNREDHDVTGFPGRRMFVFGMRLGQGESSSATFLELPRAAARTRFVAPDLGRGDAGNVDGCIEIKCIGGCCQLFRRP